MVREVNSNEGAGAVLFRCEECGLHYYERAIAERCERWCRQHGTCNIEITAEAMENRETL